ncbi:hypothetical protein U3516DRAFT_771572 [Neocallimastix sp. 'constans']
MTSADLNIEMMIYLVIHEVEIDYDNLNINSKFIKILIKLNYSNIKKIIEKGKYPNIKEYLAKHYLHKPSKLVNEESIVLLIISVIKGNEFMINLFGIIKNYSTSLVIPIHYIIKNKTKNIINV